MTIRAKFTVSKVAVFGGQNGKRIETEDGFVMREITMSAVYDDGLDKENASFSKFTPIGSITFTLTNPACAEEFMPGQAYYLDFIKAE